MRSLTWVSIFFLLEHEPAWVYGGREYRYITCPPCYRLPCPVHTLKTVRVCARGLLRGLKSQFSAQICYVQYIAIRSHELEIIQFLLWVRLWLCSLIRSACNKTCIITQLSVARLCPVHQGLSERKNLYQWSLGFYLNHHHHDRGR